MKEKRQLLTVWWTVWNLLMAGRVQTRSIDLLEQPENASISTSTSTLTSTPQSVNTSTPVLDYYRDQRESWEGFGIRNKEYRLNWIKFHILTTVGRNGLETNSSSLVIPGHTQKQIEELYDKQRTMGVNDDAEYAEKLQSFYASCDMPRNTDEELWTQGDTMNLHFQLTLPTAMQGNSIAIVAARLRLYKLSQGNSSVGNSEGGEDDWAAVEEDSRRKKWNPGERHPGTPSPGHHHQTSETLEPQQIRVSVYWYTRSLKKNKIRKKLLDSQMVSAYGEMWTEWNVVSAIRAWKESGKNFGIAVEVEDEDRIILPATNYFTPMNCSKEAATLRPIPGYFVDALREDSNIKNWDLESEQLPMIDLCTKEVPEAQYNPNGQSEGPYQETNNNNNSEGQSSVESSSSSTSIQEQDQQHNIRHRHGHHNHHHGHHHHNHHHNNNHNHPTTETVPDSHIVVNSSQQFNR